MTRQPPVKTAMDPARGIELSADAAERAVLATARLVATGGRARSAARVGGEGVLAADAAAWAVQAWARWVASSPRAKPAPAPKGHIDRRALAAAAG